MKRKASLLPILPTFALLLGLVGCRREDEKPGGMPPLPSPPAGMVPVAPAPPPQGQGGPTLPGHGPGPPPRELVMAPAAPVPSVKPPPNQSISGTIVLPAGRRGDVGRGDTIYLVARRLSQEPGVQGPMVAVKRMVAETFPIEFTLSAADAMMAGTPFEGELALTVRVDKDGDPMTKRKGDVTGAVPRVKVGSRGLTLALDTVQTEDLPSPGAAPAIPHGAAGPPAGHP